MDAERSRKPEEKGISVRYGTVLAKSGQVSAKRCFTLGVAYHMIVPLVMPFPAYFPNGRVGIMDSDLSRHNSAGYAAVAIFIAALFIVAIFVIQAIVATFVIQAPAAC